VDVLYLKERSGMPQIQRKAKLCEIFCEISNRNLEENVTIRSHDSSDFDIPVSVLISLISIKFELKFH